MKKYFYIIYIRLAVRLLPITPEFVGNRTPYRGVHIRNGFHKKIGINIHATRLLSSECECEARGEHGGGERGTDTGANSFTLLRSGGYIGTSQLQNGPRIM